MESQLFNTKKYPKSASGLQCIGPCYPKNKRSLHPIRMEIVESRDHAYCPVNQFSKYDPVTKTTKIEYLDKCYEFQNSEEIDNDIDTIMNVITPYMDFNLKQFLIIFYNIHNYEDGIEYLSSKEIPIVTSHRIFEAMLNVYGQTINIIDNRTIDFVIKLLKAMYIPVFYERLKKFFYVDKTNQEIIIRKNSQSDDNENIIIKSNFIIKKFINPNDVSKFLFKYFKKRDELSGIKELVDDFIAYIINIINASIDK